MKGVEPRDRRTGRVKETWKKKIVESDLNRTNLNATDALEAKYHSRLFNLGEMSCFNQHNAVQ